MTDAEAPILWPSDAKIQLIGKDSDAGKDWGGEGATENEMVGWHHWLNGHEFEQTLWDSEGQGNVACCSPCGHKKSDMTWWLNNSNRYVVVSHFCCFVCVSLLAVLGLRCCVQALPSGREWGLCSSCSSWTYRGDFLLQSMSLQHTDFSSCGHEFSCPMACGIFLDQGSNPCLYTGRWVLTTAPPGMSSRFN